MGLSVPGQRRGLELNKTTRATALCCMESLSKTGPALCDRGCSLDAASSPSRPTPSTNTLSKPTVAIGTGWSEDTVLHLHPHRSPNHRLGAGESWSGGAPRSATRRPYPWPRPSVLIVLFSFWASPGLSVTQLQASLVGAPWAPTSNSEAPQKTLSSASSTCYLFPTFFLAPCFINVIFGFIVLYLHLSRLSVFF